MLNVSILMGRLTKDPVVRRDRKNGQETIHAKYCLAVDRDYHQPEIKNQADFITCNAFGRNAHITEEYLKQGNKIVVKGSLRSGSYINEKGRKIYTTEPVGRKTVFCRKWDKGDISPKRDAISESI